MSMAERQWTPEQRQCIDARGGTVLVSAAAGSGKTSVLVQRVIGLMTDAVHPVDIDRLLVVTFTKAAAAEMKQRLAAELSRLLAQHPNDRRLQRQQMLLPGASISTVDGFCTSLLREHFDRLELSPQFRVAEEAETALLRSESVAEVVEDAYASQDPAFLQVAAQLSSGRDDRGLFEAVERLYTFIQSHPFPDQWMADKQAEFFADRPAAETSWGQLVMAEVVQAVEYAASLLEAAYALAQEEDIMAAAYGPSLHTDLQRLRDAVTRLPSCSWDEALALLPTLYSFISLKGLRNYEEPLRKERVTALRKEAHKRLEKLPGQLCGTDAECREDIRAIGPPIAALFALVRRFGDSYAARKKARRMVDFNDLEHGALRLLLTRSEDGTFQRTALARELSQRFEEVLVDEYQDTNATQDALFSALSQDENNLFMVGDVKQSIYGFRQAMPAIFIERRRRYPDFDGRSYPASITLGNNFRSRREVTDAVNFVFRQLMTRAAGGIAYDDREALVPSAHYSEGCGYETELLLLDDDLRDPTDAKDVAEARAIAHRIRELMATLPITENGQLRAARFGDFCILLRSKNSHAAAYVDTLNRCGIPAWAAAVGGFFQAPEIATALALLRFIDNPLQDIPLLALLLSPLCGFTPDDLAAIRNADRRCPLYVAVRRMALRPEGESAALSKACAVFLKQMDTYRMLAAALPADQLLHRLYEDTGLTAVFGARLHGAQRVANLRLLHDLARRFEQNGFRGLSAFVRHLDRLEQQSVQLSPASTVSEHADVVRILSIHNSKGLEFPVVFLAGLGGKFNMESTNANLLLHPEAGIGMQRRNADTLCQWSTLPREGVKAAIRHSEREEELRVLYVAMTRAREKLCLVMTIANPDATLARLSAGLGHREALPAGAILAARSMSDWLLSAALRHPSGAALRGWAGNDTLPVLPAATAWHIDRQSAPAPAEETAPSVTVPEADTALYAEIASRMSYRYPYAALASIPAKLAASEMAETGIRREFVATSQPALLSKDKLSPAERGTALHVFLQFARYAEAASDLETEITRLLTCGTLTERQAAVLPRSKLRHFFSGPLCQRMLASPCLLREQHFAVELPARLFRTEETLPADAADEALIIQGSADCVFEEQGVLIIVDYKTDRVKTPQELVCLYAQQLRVYAYALAKVLEKPVAACLLYAFALEEVVPVPLDADGSNDYTIKEP